jgi:hypothetical protein
MAQGNGLPRWINFDSNQQFAIQSFARKHQNLVKSRRLEPCRICGDKKQHHNNFPIGHTMKCKGSTSILVGRDWDKGQNGHEVLTPCTNTERVVQAISFKPMNATEQAELDELQNEASSDYACDVANYDAETGYAKHDLGGGYDDY